MIHHLLATTVFVVPAVAQTTVSVPCLRDNTLIENSTGALSNGAALGVFVGVTNQATGALRRGMVWFDVAASVPSGARVISALLTVNVSQSATFAPVIVHGHRVLQDWGEGTTVPLGGVGGGGAGGPSTPNSATWIHTFFPGSTWTNAGGDFAAAASLSISTPPLGLATSPLQSAIVADVQSWLDNPSQNFGWLLKTDESAPTTARRLDSRENTGGSPPVLTVTYLTNGQSTTWGTGCPVGTGTFQHAWSGPPIGGTNIQLTQTNGPANQFAANLLALSFVPQGFLLPPPCLFYLPLNGVANLGLLQLGANGSGSTPLPLPSGFPGVMIASQTAALDPNSPAGWTLSNTVIAILQ